MKRFPSLRHQPSDLEEGRLLGQLWSACVLPKSPVGKLGLEIAGLLKLLTVIILQ